MMLSLVVVLLKARLTSVVRLVTTKNLHTGLWQSCWWRLKRWVPPRVDQGWYEYQDGTIFVSPQKNEDNGWTSRRGRLAFKSTVGAYIADVLIGPGGQEIKAYEVIWERVNGRTNQAEVDALRAQLDVLKQSLLL